MGEQSHGGTRAAQMDSQELKQSALAHDQSLREIWFDSPDALIIQNQISDAYAEFRFALNGKIRFEAPALAILGASGRGKTASVIHALACLGLLPTQPGDLRRPLLECSLSARATMRDLSEEILRAYGWDGAKGTAKSLWHKACGYMESLSTEVLILDEIQHVRAAGTQDRKDLQAFLKSIVQPGGPRFMPILVGMPEFEEVLNSDTQLDRRYIKIKMRKLEETADLAVGMQILERYCTETGLQMHSSVVSKEFAARLLHAGLYSFGIVSVWSRRGIFQAMSTGATELTIEHFQEAYRSREDCVPALNPFIAVDFHNIKENQISD